MEVSKKDVSKDKLKPLEHLVVSSPLKETVSYVPAGSSAQASLRRRYLSKALERGQGKAVGISGGGISGAHQGEEKSAKGLFSLKVLRWVSCI